MGHRRYVRALLVTVFLLTLSFATHGPAAAAPRTSAVAQVSATPTPTPTPIEVNARNTVLGLLILTGCAAGGYYTAKWIRRRQRPRPPGPWFGGGGGKWKKT